MAPKTRLGYSEGVFARDTYRDLPHFIWLYDAPQFPSDANRSGRVTPVINMVYLVDGRWVPLHVHGFREEDDTGADLVTLNLKVEKTLSKWATIWMPPGSLESMITTECPKPQFRFSIRRLHGDIIDSPAFNLRIQQLFPEVVSPHP